MARAVPHARMHDIGGQNDDKDAGDGTVTAAAGAATVATPSTSFRYWVDELLWSQGRVATVQIEEVLDAMGGQRTGGPHKLLMNSSKLVPLAMGTANLIIPAAAAASGSEPQQQPISRNSSSSQLTSASSSSSLELSGPESAALPDVVSSKSNAAAGAPTLSALGDIGTGSDSGSGLSGLAGPIRRPDDHLLGYHHLRQWDLLWTKSVYAIKAARQLQPGQVVSAIAGLNCLTMKKRMVQTLRMALGAAAFRIVPLSFCIPEDLSAWQAWLATHGAAADTGLWMLKTGQDAGKGLRLVRTSQALQVALRPPQNPAKPQSHIKVAQQYITNPLLIQRRKFHLRLWLLITSHAPLRAYLHNQGLVLFSSEVYDRSNPVDGPGIKPSVSHVTNYARNEDTWVWGLDRLELHLGRQKWQELWETMCNSSAQAAAAVLGPMRAAHRWLQPSISNYGFQMLGLDYLVDENLHPWLLEVNSAPSIMAVHSDPDTCRLIKSAKQAMLHDMLAMVQHRLPQDDGSSGDFSQQQRMTWQQEYAAEMANRGGFEPLMQLFPVTQQQQQGSSSRSGVSWQPVDFQLQHLLSQQGGC